MSHSKNSAQASDEKKGELDTLYKLVVAFGHDSSCCSS